MPPLAPKKAITITPAKKLSILPGKEGKLLPEGSKFSVYGRKRLSLTATKFSGRATTGPLGSVNRYYQAGGRKVIQKIYSSKYTVVPSGADTYAVRIAGEKMYLDGRLNESAVGWLSEDGQLTTAKDFRDSLIAIDNTTVGQEYGANTLTKLWDSLSMKEKAKVVNMFANFDWNELWNEMYPHGIKGDANIDRQYELYDEIKMRIDIALEY